MKKGKVILVGAGPGDAGLLTLKGKEMLERSEAVVYDWLVNPELLELAPQAEKIFVGKKGGQNGDGSIGRTVPDFSQKEINQILLRLAKQGKLVVRLKGGDPFLFGRGGEEASFLVQHKISFEVIPGVSAGIGVPAYAGIPLTDRRFASQVTFITGHEDPTKKEAAVDWKKLSQIGGTLVSFMGVKNLPAITQALRKAGKSPETPVAVIEWGTLPEQRVVTGKLSDIVKKTKKAQIESPALTVIGEVVRLRQKLAWFEKKPLRGKTVVVTRARPQASELVRKLKDKGARVMEFPTIQIEPPRDFRPIDREIKQLSQYDWVVFTSANGVHFFFDRMRRLGKDARIFSGVRIAVIGEATAQALAEKGLAQDLIPKEFTSLSLFRALKKADEIRGKKFLLARADIAPPDLRKALEKAGARVVEIEAYRTRRTSGNQKDLFEGIQKGKIDYVTFTSSSTVENFFDPLPRALLKRIRSQLISIGPVTTEALRRYGFKPAREAKVHTIEGLVNALIHGNGGGKK